MYSWVCGHPPGPDWPIQDHTLKENWFFLPREPPAIKGSLAMVWGIMTRFLSMMVYLLTWFCVSNHSCCGHECSGPVMCRRHWLAVVLLTSGSYYLIPLPRWSLHLEGWLILYILFHYVCVCVVSVFLCLQVMGTCVHICVEARGQLHMSFLVSWNRNSF